VRRPLQSYCHTPWCILCQSTACMCNKCNHCLLHGLFAGLLTCRGKSAALVHTAANAQHNTEVSRAWCPSLGGVPARQVRARHARASARRALASCVPAASVSSGLLRTAPLSCTTGGAQATRALQGYEKARACTGCWLRRGRKAASAPQGPFLGAAGL